jgi:thioredoxin reductase (NADPH)
VLDSVVEAIEGEDMVERILVRNVKNGTMTPLEVAGIFMFVGTRPRVEFLDGLLERREGGGLVTDRNLATSVPGIFAAGDVRDTPLRQAVTAAADGALAAMGAYHYLERRR